MSILKISGHSDDIVYYSVGNKKNELSPPETEMDPYMGTLLVHSGKGRCLIHVLYDGCWSFAVSKDDEDDDTPWPATVTWEGFSQVLHMDVPKGTKVEWRR
jgi:hypothetical protein